MTQVNFEFTDRELQNALDGLIDRVADLTPALNDLGEHLLRKTRQRFDTATAPDGTKWRSLGTRTIRAKQRRQRTGKPYRTRANPLSVLQDTFMLRDSITYQVSSNVLAVGTNVEYGIYHQSPESRTKIPARPFLGLDDADRAEAVVILRDHLKIN